MKYPDYKIELIEEVINMDLITREIYYINTIECVNIIHNKNTCFDTFNCVCGEIINSTNRYKHCKSSIHRKLIKQEHLKIKNISYFISKYKKFNITNNLLNL